jgi:hypothetical protein
MEQKVIYRGMVMPISEMVKALRGTGVDPDNELSDEFLINEAHGLEEWEDADEDSINKDTLARFMDMVDETGYRQPHFTPMSFGQNIDLEDMRFDSSYEWLMEVVEVIYETEVDYNSAESDAKIEIKGILVGHNLSIGNLYKAVLKFINLYNENKETN